MMGNLNCTELNNNNNNNNPAIKLDETDEIDDETNETYEAKLFRLDEERQRMEEIIKEHNKIIEEEIKLDIWNAHVRDEYIAIKMKDGTCFVGKTLFSIGENYTSTEELQRLFCIDLKLANGMPYLYHIGGGYVSLFTSKMKKTVVMNEFEIDDSKQYANFAPEFIKRLFSERDPDPELDT